LDEGTIKPEILPYLSVAKRGYVSEDNLMEVVPSILYKLKTACRRQNTTSFAWCCMREAYPATIRAGRSKRTIFRCRWPLARVYDIIVLSSFWW